MINLICQTNKPPTQSPVKWVCVGEAERWNEQALPTGRSEGYAIRTVLMFSFSILFHFSFCKVGKLWGKQDVLLSFNIVLYDAY